MSKPTAYDDFLFDLRGYLILKNAIAPDLLERLNAEFDQFPRDLPLGEWYQGAQRRDYDPATGIELHHAIEIGGPFEELIDHPSWIDYARHYCGEEDSYLEGLFIDECIASIRTGGGYHPFHSGGYRVTTRCHYRYEHGVFRCGQVNMLMALTDIGPGDGATIVIPGSHKSNMAHPEMGEYSYGGSKANTTPPEAVEAHLEKGDVLLFSDAIMHGGSARTNPGERRVVIFRYGPSWARTRYNYVYSPELVERLPRSRRRLVQPIPPCRPGDNFVPMEAPFYARQEDEAAAESSATAQSEGDR